MLDFNVIANLKKVFSFNASFNPTHYYIVPKAFSKPAINPLRRRPDNFFTHRSPCFWHLYLIEPNCHEQSQPRVAIFSGWISSSSLSQTSFALFLSRVSVCTSGGNYIRNEPAPAGRKTQFVSCLGHALSRIYYIRVHLCFGTCTVCSNCCMYCPAMTRHPRGLLFLTARQILSRKRERI